MLTPTWGRYQFNSNSLFPYHVDLVYEHYKDFIFTNAVVIVSQRLFLRQWSGVKRGEILPLMTTLSCEGPAPHRVSTKTTTERR